MSHKITPFIRCAENGHAVAQSYVDIFGADATITKTNPAVTSFEVFGQSLSTLTGGPHPGAAINASISFSLRIRSEERTKELWDKLSEGGQVLMAFDAYPRSKAYGRCNDKYGVSRQVMYDDCEEHATSTLIPSLMFTGANAGKAKEAMGLYTSLFPASSINNTRPYGENAMGENPEYLNHAEFTLVNQLFIAMDSSADHKFNFTDGISLAVSCKDQEEVDYYWNKLALDGGVEVQCGRCKDKYGVARQIFPIGLPDALFQEDQAKAKYAMDAMMKMKKIVLADLYQK